MPVDGPFPKQGEGQKAGWVERSESRQDKQAMT